MNVTSFGNGYTIGYSQVTETQQGGKSFGKKILNYHNPYNTTYINAFRKSYPNANTVKYDGKLLQVRYFDANDVLIKQDTLKYSLLDEKLISGVAQDGVLPPSTIGTYGNGTFFQYPLFSRWEVMIQKEEITFYDNGQHQTNTTYYYDNVTHKNLTKTEFTDSRGDTTITQTWYPDDVIDETSLGATLTDTEFTAIERLKTDGEEFRPAQPIQTQTVLNGQKSVQRTNFKYWNNKFTLPEFVQTAKGADAMENRIVYNDYDLFGNPLEVQKEDGTHISYIWGYNYSYPIAKVVNATYQEIATALGLSIPQLKALNESNLDTINTLRTTLLDAQTTTFTYDVLVGVTSVTDPSDYTMYYEYDDFQRLKFVKDDEGKILSQNQYHYKNN